MNESVIVKFLAEQMKLHKTRTGFAIEVYSPNWELKTVQPFDPWNSIAHAWAVVEWLHKEDWSLYLTSNPYGRTSAIFKRLQAEPNPEETIADGENSTPEAICIAATRTLATDEQCKEWGL